MIDPLTIASTGTVTPTATRANGAAGTVVNNGTISSWAGFGVLLAGIASSVGGGVFKVVADGSNGIFITSANPV